jgi:hypothetical protein
MRRNGQSLLLITALLIGSAFLSGCGTESEKHKQLWTSLEMSFRTVGRTYLIDNRLLVAAGPEGVFEQKPAVTGRWKNIGLAFPEYGSEAQYGVFSLAMHSGELIAGCFLPSTDNRPRLYRLEAGDTAWAGTISPYGTADIWDVVSTDCDTILAISTKGGLISTNGGKTWEPQYQSPGVNLGLFYNGPGGLFLSIMTDFFEPRIARSMDCGATWTLTPPTESGLPTDGSITSIGSSEVPLPSLFLCLNGNLYFSRDWGDTFTVALRTPADFGGVSVNPYDSREVLVSADSLYFSGDNGQRWDSFGPPVGPRFGLPIVSDWQQGYSVVAVWDGSNYLLFSFDINVARGL